MHLNIKTKKLENISSLFGNCASLETIDLSFFNTENTKNMADLFSGCEDLKNIIFSKNFSTKNVTNMSKYVLWMFFLRKN